MPNTIVFANLPDGLQPLSLFDQALANVIVRAQRSVTSAAGLPIVATDSMINLNCAAPLTIPLPAASSRNGLPLTFKDAGGQAAVNNITLTPNGAEKIDGATSFVMAAAYQTITFYPFNDGTNTGWFIT